MQTMYTFEKLANIRNYPVQKARLRSLAQIYNSVPSIMRDSYLTID